MAYPTDLDNLSNPTPTDTMNTVPHSAQHSNANDAIEALQVKVGIDGSADTDSLDYKVAENTTKLSGIEDNATADQTASELLALVAPLMFPVGAIYISGVSTNPATLLGFGTWSQITNRVIVGQGSGTFATLNATGGSETQTLTQANLPSGITGNVTAHASRSSFWAPNGVFSGSTMTSNNYAAAGADTGGANSVSVWNFNLGGSGTAHNNLQPYIVKYIWERTA